MKTKLNKVRADIIRQLHIPLILIIVVQTMVSCSSDSGGDESNIVHGLPVAYGGETYETVVIGTQTWMARNLNYAAEGGVCYDNKPDNCKKYGRLYDWSTALALPDSCNYNFCTDQINYHHKGICPDGFHIPSDAEWYDLLRFVDDENGGDGRWRGKYYDSWTAAKYLRAEKSWFNYRNNVSVDKYGFSALPGGHGYSNGDFYGISENGRWLIVAMSGTRQFYNWDMSFGNDQVTFDYDYKIDLFSVRCLSDDSGDKVNIVHGSPVAYEGETYETVVIGEQTWMARNLNYDAEGSVCYDEDPANCDKYGRLYDWSTAMALDTNCNSNFCASQIQPKHKGICPDGFHIPANAEWDKLFLYVGGATGTDNSYSPYSSYTAGRYLKAASGWREGGNGEDTYGFAALPGGFGGIHFGFLEFRNASEAGSWWSANESEDSADRAYGYDMHYLGRGAGGGGGSPKFYDMYSIRCVKD